MDRGTRNLFVVALVVVVVIAGAAAFLLGGSSTATAPSDLPTVDGVVVGVDAEGLSDVQSFDLRTSDGTVLTFGLEALENGTMFPPGHLAEHQVSAQRVRVWYRDPDGTPQAIWLEDAP